MGDPNANRLTGMAVHARIYCYACFCWMLGMQITLSAMVVRFGGAPNYDEWTNGGGFFPSLAMVLFGLGIPVFLLWGVGVLHMVFANPCPWEPPSSRAVRLCVYAGLICVIAEATGIVCFMASVHLYSLAGRLGFVAAAAAFDAAFVWWVACFLRREQNH